MDRTEYFARPETRQALEELDQACFAVRENGEGEDAFPDAMSFLRERGVDPPGAGSIRMHHTVEEEGTTVEDLMQPMKPLPPGPCPGGECRPVNCRMVGGQWICSWVCHCP